MSNPCCWICGAQTGVLYNIYDRYQDSWRAAKDDLEDFLGRSVAKDFKDDDHICEWCRNAAANIASLKRRIRDRDPPTTEGPGPRDLGPLWRLLASERVLETAPPATYPTPTSIQSPSDLYVVSHSVIYDPMDKTNEEVAGIMQTGRKRGRPRSSTADPIRTKTPRTRSRANSGANSRANSRARSMSRGTVSRGASNLLNIDERQFIVCDEPNCNTICETIDQNMMHKKLDHNAMLLYRCAQCDHKYPNREHLWYHILFDHEKITYNCFMCGVEVFTSTNLQAHIKKHMLYSVPCQFCDKFFLSHHALQFHVRNAHKTKSQRIRRKPINILWAVDYDDGEMGTETCDPQNGRVSPPIFRLIQTGLPKDDAALRRHFSTESSSGEPTLGFGSPERTSACGSEI